MNFSMKKIALLFALLCSALITLSGCDALQTPKKFTNTDITGAPFGKDFSLTDHTGVKRTLADYRGKAIVMFFGFTQCPDVCPTTMVEMGEVLKKMGAQAERVQVLFITVDPERDTQQMLSQYVPAFDARFVGLTGTLEEVAQVARDFKVFYEKVPTANGKSYTMDHFAGMYAFDPQGRLRLLLQKSSGIEAIAADLKTLLSAS
jgi:protein SCO1/2